MKYKIDKAFNKLQILNRSTEEFRQKWIGALRNLGFHVERFEYTQRVFFETPHHTSTITKTYVTIFIILLFLLYIFVKYKNLIQFK